MEYTLKDKIKVDKEFLTELATKNWQEIEHIQSQIANIEVADENNELLLLFKNLLTSYYIFVGGIENLIDNPQTSTAQTKYTPNINNTKTELQQDTIAALEADSETAPAQYNTKANIDTFEPFEYFVEFDEPTGAPLSDDDLYGN